MIRFFHYPLTASITLAICGPVALADTASKEQSTAAPAGAIVLFDGKDLSGWTSLNGRPAPWKVTDGYMEVVPGKGNIITKKTFGPDFQLHVEFWLPLMADQKGQTRANSGVYLLGRYEIQVLDSYMNQTYADGSCGALYGIHAPKTNASKPPEQWQTFDITCHAMRLDSQGKIVKKGRVTVVHNGVTIIENGEFDRTTRGGIDEKLVSEGPILLQDHHNKAGKANVRFRNIWLKPL